MCQVFLTRGACLSPSSPEFAHPIQAVVPMAGTVRARGSAAGGLCTTRERLCASMVTIQTPVMAPAAERSSRRRGATEPTPAFRRPEERRPSGRTWLGVLAALGTSLLVLNVVTFYPGFMSTDSVQQLMQARDWNLLSDWHPPVMTVLWWLLLKLSFQTVGVMLVAQLALLWGSLTLLAVYVFQESGRRGVSLLPLLLGVLPHVSGISGVIWKDNQLAFSMLAAVVLLLHVRRGIERRWLRNAAVAGALLLLAYAGAVRYNALPAIVPLLFLFTWPGATRPRRTRVVLAGAAVLAALVVTPVIDAVRPVQATYPAASIMLDDVMHLYTVDELRDADVSASLKGPLVSLARACPPAELDINYTWRCANPNLTVPSFFATDYDELRGLYLSGIVEHPLRYAQYRATVFTQFLDTPPEESFVYWHGIDANPYGLTFTPNVASEALGSYVAFSSANFGFLYKPFFWLLAALVALVVVGRRRASFRHAGVIVPVGVSSVLYIATYLPTVIGYDYRYVYWPAIGMSAVAILLLVDRVARRRTPPASSDRARALLDVPLPRASRQVA